jgi:molybdopterin-guanine dinucleotide biosynthesis protein A
MSGVVGVLLAGGRARRMGGGDKCLRTLAGETLLARAIGRARTQVDALLLSANGDAARFAEYGLPVVADAVSDFAGPLAGVLAGMDWAAHEAGASDIVTMPTDAPFFPGDLVARLVAARHEAGAVLAVAASRGRSHPVFGLWPVGLRGDLRAALEVEGVRKIDVWTARYKLATVAFEAENVDPFFNANTPGELEEAAVLIGQAP